MTLQLRDVEIDVYDPKSFPNPSSADRTISFDQIRSIEVKQRLDDVRDRATITLDNSNGQAIDNLPLHSRAVVFVKSEFDSSTRSIFSAYPQRVEARKDNSTGGDNVLTAQCSDFVMGRLGDQLVSNAFRDRQVFGASDAIVDSIVAEAENVSLSGNFGTSETTTIGWNYDDQLAAVREVAQRTGAIISSNATDLFFDAVSNTAVQHTIDANDTQHPKGYRENDQLLKNRVVVIGGQSSRVDEENTGQSSTTTVSNNNAVTSPEIVLDKPRVSSVEVYTATTGSGATMRCGIQQANSSGNAPAPDDRSQDLRTAQVTASNLTNGGPTRFEFNLDSVPSDIVLCVDTASSDQQEVGLDGNSDLVFKVYYSFPVVAEAKDAASQDDYLTVGSKETTNIQDKQVAEDVANAELNRNNEPGRYYFFQASQNPAAANPDRTHKLEPGDAIRIDDADFNISGRKHVVISKTTTIEGPIMDVGIEAQDIETLS